MAAPESHPFRIAVVGGGLGGLFTALSIHHHCTSTGANIKIDIYEQAAQYKEIGNGVSIGVNAARLMHKLDLGDRLSELASEWFIEGLPIARYDNSETIFIVTRAGETGKVRTSTYARSDLLDMLRVAIEERDAATLHTKKSCQYIEDDGDIARIHFGDETTAEANLVVASDGINSAVRGQLRSDKPIYSGRIAYRGIVPLNLLSDWPFPRPRIWVAKGRHIIMYPISRNTKLNVVGVVNKEEDEVNGVKESWSTFSNRKEVERDFAGFDKYVQEVIGLLPEKTLKWKINDREPLDQWHYLNGKVFLMGDAAHAMSPHLGAGAGQSVEDGWVLARALSEHLSITKSTNPKFESLASTAQFVQSIRLPRAQRTQMGSRAAGDTYDMKTPDMLDKSFEDCVPFFAEKIARGMQRVWEQDVDEAYEKMRDGEVNGVGQNGVH